MDDHEIIKRLEERITALETERYNLIKRGAITLLIAVGGLVSYIWINNVGH